MYKGPKYDFLIVGSGLFGATFAYKANQAGKSCLVIDKRPQLGGNVYCEKTEGINVHKYGAHIFHTANKAVWDFVNALVPFNRYTKYVDEAVNGDFRDLSTSWNRGRQFAISVSYRFGSLKASVKKAARSIENDDVVGGITKGN